MKHVSVTLGITIAHTSKYGKIRIIKMQKIK
jgi:hypothetical protein